MAQSESSSPKKEVILRGVGASPGVAVGPALLMAVDEKCFVEREISADEVAGEIARFEEALIKTRRQLHEIQERVSSAIGQSSASIFDAHLLVVDDRSFVEEVIRGLEEEHRNVEAVLYGVAERYARALSQVDDDYLRERAADVRDVARRIVRNLAGVSPGGLDAVEKPCVVIAHDLAPSDTATMSKDKVVGLATDLGSRTSHTAIMARALEIPAVVGLHDVSVRVTQSDQVLLDGSKGILIINPTPERLAQYNRTVEKQRSIRMELARLKEEPAATLDGRRVVLSANIELPSDVDAVLEVGAEGAGLFRTEFLYLTRDSWPDEDTQADVYEEVARRLAPAPVIIRTLDLGGDKFLSHMKVPAEENPFMGWRAIRFCLAQPDIFMTQLRAILRASRRRNVKLMYPMVSTLDEVVRANAFLEQAKNELREKGIEFNEDLEVGIMIEVPSAALIADVLAEHVAFFSLGTNDLVQYTLAVDRVNERVAYLYEPTHPAILKLINNTIRAGHDHGVWVGICGEMAGNPLMVPLLVGLGIDELSVSPSMVPMVKRVIRSLQFEQAEKLKEEALKADSGLAVAERCRELLADIAPELLEFVA